MPVEFGMPRPVDPALRLAGRGAIVTGAGSAGPLAGTGVATSAAFAAQGASVAVVDVSEERAANTVAWIEANGGKCAAVGRHHSSDSV